MAARQIIFEEGHQRLAKARYGYVLYNKNDMVVGRLVEVYGEYFESEVEVFRQVLRRGDIAMDVGANIGTHTQAMARLVGPTGFVFGFEPQRMVFQTLCANMAMNSIDNVECVHAALSDTPGTLELADADPNVTTNYGGIPVSALSNRVVAPRIPQYPLDDYYNLDRLKLIKIDVEGMEAPVLRGARKTLEKFKPFLYVENDRVDKSPELLDLLTELGYRSYWHLPLYLNPLNHYAEPRPVFHISFMERGGEHLDGIGFAINMICVHNSLTFPVTGLREATDHQEHPYKRAYNHLFLVKGGPPGPGQPGAVQG